MFSVFIAATKFQCHRLARYIHGLIRDLLVRIFKWLVPVKGRIAAGIVDGEDKTMYISERIAENNEIGIANMPGDIIGRGKDMTILMKDGSVLFVDGKSGKYVYKRDGEVVIEGVADAWDNIEVLGEKEL